MARCADIGGCAVAATGGGGGGGGNDGGGGGSDAPPADAIFFIFIFSANAFCFFINSFAVALLSTCSASTTPQLLRSPSLTIYYIFFSFFTSFNSLMFLDHRGPAISQCVHFFRVDAAR